MSPRSLNKGVRALRSNSLEAKIYGAWLGKSIGGTLGLPSEGKMQRQNYTFYDPIPTAAPPNDDLELQLVWLHLLDSAKGKLTREDFAGAWRKHLHYMWDEYGRARWNLRRGVPTDALGIFENPFHAGMGSSIRSEIWACVASGDPATAAYYAALDASIDHGLEGIAGEVFFAVMQSLVLDGVPVPESISEAADRLPGSSETSQAIRLVIQQARKGTDTWICWKELLAEHGSENFTHAPLNVALTVWALLHGEGDFGKTLLLATNGGYDTDCTAATAGATLGMANPSGIPAQWSDPIGHEIFIGPGIQGIDVPRTLQELTDRALALVAKLERKQWSDLPWAPPAVQVELSSLPGTISISPLNDPSLAIPWANGELPAATKAAKGATWNWEVTHSDPRTIVCLARAGANFYLDGKCVFKCPPSLPFVPATHRAPAGSSFRIQPGRGNHAIRIDLGSATEQQEATVILAYPDGHLCPWTAVELPDRANLPVPIS
jgi:ADP-ribosylglycohydrolase